MPLCSTHHALLEATIDKAFKAAGILSLLDLILISFRFQAFAKKKEEGLDGFITTYWKELGLVEEALSLNSQASTYRRS